MENVTAWYLVSSIQPLRPAVTISVSSPSQTHSSGVLCCGSATAGTAVPMRAIVDMTPATSILRMTLPPRPEANSVTHYSPPPLVSRERSDFTSR